MFQNVSYVGKAKDDYVRKVAGQGADFRYDAKGVKFYGYSDDGLYFEDRDGNLFQAKRRVSVSEDPNADYKDMFDHIQEEDGGQFSDEHAMTQEGAAGSDREAFGPSDTKGLLHNLTMQGSRRGGRDGEIISGPSQEERERAARADRQATDYGMKTARSYNFGGVAGPKGDPIEEMEAKIVSAMKGGASDQEISQMVKQSGLGKDYVFNWDNVEMRVTSFKKKDHSMYIDPKGRGYGGPGSSKTEDMLERLSDMGRGRKAGKGKTFSY